MQVFAVSVGAERPVGAGPKDLLTLCQGRARRGVAPERGPASWSSRHTSYPRSSSARAKEKSTRCFAELGSCAKNQGSFCLCNKGFWPKLQLKPILVEGGDTKKHHLVFLQVGEESPTSGRFLPTNLKFLDGHLSLNENRRPQAHPGD